MSEELLNTTEQVNAIEEEKIEWAEPARLSETDESWLEPLLNSGEIDELQSRWNSVQVEFVDDPHNSVKQADSLVAETIEKIARKLAKKRTALDESWVGHEDLSTEDFRVALQHYRSFFNRLLAIE